MEQAPNLVSVSQVHPAPSVSPRSSHLYSLDALRGIASLSVVLWHWSLFATAGKAGAAFQTSSQPFFGIFFPFYLEGARAVDLFFCLSGFVFYWLYEARISQRRISGGEFAVLRFSRLYPLHLVTLLLVAVGQWFMRSAHGADFVYGHNDRHHFLLQLFMASNWGFEDGFSFNGPIWSVSVEVLLYGCFFGMCRMHLVRWWHLTIAMLAGLGMLVFVSPDLGSGTTGFFAGCLTAWVWRHISLPRKWFLYLVLPCLCAWILIPLNARHLYLYHLYEASSLKLTWIASGREIVGSIIERLCGYMYQLVLFPFTILVLALFEQTLKQSLKTIAWLGNLSYASYLWHFPLQLALYALALHWGYDWRLFMSPWMLMLFFAMLIVISLLSYHFIELPAQNWIRKAWKQRRAK